MRYLIIDGEQQSDVIVTLKNIDAPQLKSAYVDVPGANSSLDLSTVLTDGNPVYERRLAEFMLAFKDVVGADFFTLQSEWNNRYHGREVAISYTGVSDLYLTGRIKLMDWEETKAGTTVKLEMDADPFWYEKDETTATGAASTTPGTIVTLANGRCWVAPVIDPSAAMEIMYGGKLYSVQAGLQRAPWLVLKSGDNEVALIGAGTCDFVWRKGWL